MELLCSFNHVLLIESEKKKKNVKKHKEKRKMILIVWPLVEHFIYPVILIFLLKYLSKIDFDISVELLEQN